MFKIVRQVQEWWRCRRERDSGLIHGMYPTPKVQAHNLQQWNKDYRLGIPDAGFSALEFPEWHHDHNGHDQPWVLVPYFQSPFGLEHSVLRTFNVLWGILSLQCQVGVVPTMMLDVKHLRLAPQVEYPQCILRWEQIDLGPMSEHGGDTLLHARGITSAHAGVLAALCHFPLWREKIQKRAMPFPVMAGYECRAYGSEQWTSAPLISPSVVTGKLFLGPHALSESCHEHAVPTIIKILKV